MSADQRDLREWLPFDAATHDLARRMGQRMGWPELLQLALDGHAALCVFLPPVEVHAPGAGAGGVTAPGAHPRTVEGVWDLPAEGLARQHLHQLLRDNTGGAGPLLAEIRTGLVVERGTTRWEIPQRVWRDHVMTGSALAVRWKTLDALVGAQNDLDTRAGASEASLSPAPPVPADEVWAQTATGRQARIDKFLQALVESGALKGLMRIHPKADERPLHEDEQLIWEAAAYATNAAWCRWKGDKQQPNAVAGRRFRRLLALQPSAFMQEWTMHAKRTGRVRVP